MEKDHLQSFKMKKIAWLSQREEKEKLNSTLTEFKIQNLRL